MDHIPYHRRTLRLVFQLDLALIFTTDTPRNRHRPNPLPQPRPHAVRQQSKSSSFPFHFFPIITTIFSLTTQSQIVVPTQFVMFNLSAIVGSAILYGDFRRASFHQIVTFLYGCAATFAGVFIIAWSPPPASPGEDGEQTELTGEGGESLDLEAGNVEGGGVVPRDVRMGSLGRRDRPTLVIPESVVVDGSAHGTPVLRNRQSMIDLIGLSPAQVSYRVLE